MKLFYTLVFLNIFYFNAIAQTNGRGCNNGSAVYSVYLRTFSYYGDASKPVRVYSNATSYPSKIDINFNNSIGYKCNMINIYSATTKYNPSTGANDPVPAQNEILTSSNNTAYPGCVIASTLNGTPSGEGPDVTYTMSNPTYCSTQVPLDTNITYLIFISGLLGLYLMRTQEFNYIWKIKKLSEQKE